jgi:hypothetical protein
VQAISIKIFPVYSGKCLSRKAGHNWVEKFSQGRPKVTEDARPGAEVAVTEVKRLECCRFWRTGKRWDKFVSVRGEYIEKYFFIQARIRNVLLFISNCGPFTDSPSHLHF